MYQSPSIPHAIRIPGRLFNRTLDQARRSAAGRLGRDDMAVDDVAAEAVVRALATLEASRQDPTHLARRIASRLALDEQRRRRGRGAAPLARRTDPIFHATERDDITGIRCERPNPEETLIRREQRGILYRSIRELPPAQRAVVAQLLRDDRRPALSAAQRQAKAAALRSLRRRLAPAA